MVNCLDKFEEIFLSDGSFVNGFSKITFADILAACEIEQPRMAGYEPQEGRPKLTAWLQAVKNKCNPYYDEAHGILNKIAKQTKKGLEAKL
ncbi:hypothetical protein NQ317_001554 [Molorchus minor]|uniref:Glutathione S-transferase C-terminal domain-containing protein n=1 Tax=Molorchus minor TaxID=1323400 RepID=A0ABQ9J2P2_9CUCU|nr:hypothetical protein NQ317_001554 [Molorchus minor]